MRERRQASATSTPEATDRQAVPQPPRICTVDHSGRPARQPSPVRLSSCRLCHDVSSAEPERYLTSRPGAIRSTGTKHGDHLIPCALCALPLSIHSTVGSCRPTWTMCRCMVSGLCTFRGRTWAPAPPCESRSTWHTKLTHKGFKARGCRYPPPRRFRVRCTWAREDTRPDPQPSTRHRHRS